VLGGTQRAAVFGDRGIHVAELPLVVADRDGGRGRGLARRREGCAREVRDLGERAAMALERAAGVAARREHGADAALGFGYAETDLGFGGADTDLGVGDAGTALGEQPAADRER